MYHLCGFDDLSVDEELAAESHLSKAVIREAASQALGNVDILKALTGIQDPPFATFLLKGKALFTELCQISSHLKDNLAMWHTIYDIIKGIVDEYEHLHMEDLASEEEQGFGVNQENLENWRNQLCRVVTRYNNNVD